MPNVKLFVDQARFAQDAGIIAAALGPLREVICREFRVQPSACQIAALPVMGLSDQPGVNVEIQFLATPERTPERIRAVCSVLRAHLEKTIGAGIALRATPLDRATYVALK